MATWKPTNSKLTEKGVEILNKVSVGSGKLQISKIIAADGSVAESALYSSTSLVGTTHQMSLSKVVALASISINKHKLYLPSSFVTPITSLSYLFKTIWPI